MMAALIRKIFLEYFTENMKKWSLEGFKDV